MTDDEVVQELVQVFLGAERVDTRDLHNRFPYGDAKVNMLIHEAREIVRREHGIDFMPVRGFPKLLQRAAPHQIAHRSLRGRRAGMKKLTRAQERMALAAEKTADVEARARLERAASRQREHLVNATIRSRRLPDP